MYSTITRTKKCKIGIEFHLAIKKTIYYSIFFNLFSLATIIKNTILSILYL